MPSVSALGSTPQGPDDQSLAVLPARHGNPVAHDDANEWDEHYSKTLLAEFKELADRQRSQAERLSSRARQVFAYLGIVFGITQAAALAAFASTLVSNSERQDILTWGIIAAVGLGVTGICAILAEVVWSFSAVGEKDIEEAGDEAVANDEDVALLLAAKYQEQVREAATPLRGRTNWLGVTQTFAALTLIAIIVEIILALNARIG